MQVGAPLLLQALEVAEQAPPLERAAEEVWRGWEAERIEEISALLRRRSVAAALPEEASDALGADGASTSDADDALVEQLGRAILALALWMRAAKQTDRTATVVPMSASGVPRATSPFSSLRTNGSQWTVRGPWIEMLVGQTTRPQAQPR